MNKMLMKVTFLVPIKLKSERLPNKMLLPLGTKLLCQYIFDTLLEVKREIECEIYCFCSNEEIKKYLPSDVIFLKREENLDSNDTKGIDIYKSFISKIDSDIYALCHATSPFIKKESILRGVYDVVQNSFDSAFSASEIKTFIWYKGSPLNTHLTMLLELKILNLYIGKRVLFTFSKKV